MKAKAQTKAKAAAEKRHPLATDAALQLIVGHCRFVITRLPHGVLAGKTAHTYLANLAAACSRGVPDICGSPTGSIRRATEFGLLPVLPCDKVAQAMVKLLAGLSPIVELPGPRSCTLWITHLLDREFQVELRRITPKSYQHRGPLPRSAKAYTRSACQQTIRELSGALHRCEEKLAREESARRRAEDALAAELVRAAELTEQHRDLATLNGLLLGKLDEALDMLAKRELQADQHRAQMQQMEARIRSSDDERANLRRELASARRATTKSEQQRRSAERLLIERGERIEQAERIEQHGQGLSEQVEQTEQQGQERSRQVEQVDRNQPERPAQAGRAKRRESYQLAGLSRLLESTVATEGSGPLAGVAQPKIPKATARGRLEPPRAVPLDEASLHVPKIKVAHSQRSERLLDALKAFGGRTSPEPTGTSKIGRNQLCTCGSGKKYKRCCGC